MTLSVLNINFIKVTGKTRVVGLNVLSNGISTDVTYILNDEANDIVMQKTRSPNKTSLVDLSGNVLHNMYDSSIPFFKSAVYRVSKAKRFDDTYDFENIFLHEDDTKLLNAIRVDDTIYSLMPQSTYGHSTLSIDSNLYLAKDNNLTTLPNNKIETYLYDKNVISSVVMGLTKPSQLSANEEIKKTLFNVNYSTVCEIPGNILNDFDSSNIVSNTYKTKNLYDSLYNMDHNDEFILANCRTYCGIDNCNLLIYLKYYDNVKYTESSNDGSSTYLSGESNLVSDMHGFKLLNIETIKKISRLSAPTGHRSNLYSIKINSDMLKTSLLNPVREVLENQIKTSVRDIAKKLQPSLTELFEVILGNKQAQLCTLTLNAIGGGVAIGAGQYKRGRIVKIHAEPLNSSYRFIKWSDGSTDAMREIVMDSDIELIAVFSRRYLITNLLLKFITNLKQRIYAR